MSQERYTLPLIPVLEIKGMTKQLRSYLCWLKPLMHAYACFTQF